MTYHALTYLSPRSRAVPVIYIYTVCPNRKNLYIIQAISLPSRYTVRFYRTTSTPRLLPSKLGWVMCLGSGGLRIYSATDVYFKPPLYRQMEAWPLEGGSAGSVKGPCTGRLQCLGQVDDLIVGPITLFRELAQQPSELRLRL